MVEIMQSSLQQIRKIMGYSTIEFSQLLGITRQSLNNIETGRVKLSVALYLAICAIIDNAVEKDDSLYTAIARVLEQEYQNSTDSEIAYEPTHSHSFLKRWFLCFPDGTAISPVPQFDKKLTKLDLRSIAENYLVFIDFSFLEKNSKDDIPMILDDLSSYMMDYKNKYRLAYKVTDKVESEMFSPEAAIQSTGKNAFEILKYLRSHDLLEILGSPQDGDDFINTYLSFFLSLKTTNRILLLTEDETIAERVHDLNKDGIEGFATLAARREDDGLIIF